MKTTLRCSLAVCAAVFTSSSPRLFADVVTADDAIIQGSLAVGLDAVNNETFGLDTLRLKANNTRLSFIDTSASAGFPANDWTIIANDSFSGGANYLGFLDKGTSGGVDGSDSGTLSFRIQAGAMQGALWVDSNSRVAMGTTTPLLHLHMTDGNTPGIRLEQNGTSGYTPQTWDMAGNEANFFVRDLTHGSTLPFRIRPGAPTSSLDISVGGNVGIGTPNPIAKLDVEGTVFISQTLEIGSSRTRKENIRDLPLEDARETLKALNPVQFNYKTDTQTQLGFIAEDVPDLVATKERKSLVPMDFVAVLTKVSQDHETKAAAMAKKLQDQQAVIDKLEARLAALEGTLQSRVGAPDAPPSAEEHARHLAEHAAAQDTPAGQGSSIK